MNVQIFEQRIRISKNVTENVSKKNQNDIMLFFMKN